MKLKTLTKPMNRRNDVATLVRGPRSRDIRCSGRTSSGAGIFSRSRSHQRPFWMVRTSPFARSAPSFDPLLGPGELPTEQGAYPLNMRGQRTRHEKHLSLRFEEKPTNFAITWTATACMIAWLARARGHIFSPGTRSRFGFLALLSQSP